MAPEITDIDQGVFTKLGLEFYSGDSGGGARISDGVSKEGDAMAIPMTEFQI